MADSLTCSLEGRAFQALLSGLCRSNFFGERITHESLALQLFSGLQRQEGEEGEGELEPAEVAAQIRIFEKVPSTHSLTHSFTHSLIHSTCITLHVSLCHSVTSLCEVRYENSDVMRHVVSTCLLITCVT
jgi:hypothetical protein